MRLLTAFAALFVSSAATPQDADLLVYGEVVYTMEGGELNAIEDGVVYIEDGVIQAVGPADGTQIPKKAMETRRAAVVVPGLIDPRSTAGLTGIYNQPQDQDIIETSKPIQPELRALDAYNGRDELVGFLRAKGVTTLHTGHAAGEAMSGQLFVVKTREGSVGESVLVETSAVSATLAPSALNSGGKGPGTRAKLAMILRDELIDAQEYKAKVDAWQAKKDAFDAHTPAEGESEPDESAPKDPGDPPSRNLRLEALASVLSGDVPLLVTANRAQDIDTALRLADEFGFTLWLDSGAEAYLVAEELRAAGVPVFLHPTMARPWGDMQNMSWTTAGRLADAGLTVMTQSGYEGYVPKVRVVLFEAAIAAVNGWGFERALAGLTITPARVLGIDDRVGSIEIGKDGDLALYDGDPFEYTTRCVGTVIEGVVVSDGE